MSIKHFFLSIYFYFFFADFIVGYAKVMIGWLVLPFAAFTFVDAITNHSTFAYIIFSISLFDFDVDLFFFSAEFCSPCSFFPFSFSFIARDLALVNIMLLAGMSIELKALVQKLWPVLRLSILPTLGEVLIIAVIAKYVLAMPFLWSFLLG